MEPGLWEKGGGCQQSSKRSGNVAAGNGRVFAHTGVNPTVEPGLNVPAVAFNASTAAVLWEQPGLVLWTLPMGGRFCASTPQYLPGSDLLLLAALSEDRRSLELTTLPAALGRTCPQRPAEQDTVTSCLSCP
eukprot:XP_001703048.1 predicted protein [Chlamydomonas reinhardtii]